MKALVSTRTTVLVAFLLLLLVVGSFFGLNERSAQITSSRSIHATSLYDKFTQDTSLNRTIWEVNGLTARVTIPNWSIPPASIVSPSLEFSQNGMSFAGVHDPYEVAAVQSVDTFSPPFIAEAAVRGVESNGNSFVFAIVSTDGSQEAGLSGDLNTSDAGDYGLWEHHWSTNGPWMLLGYSFWSFFDDRLVSDPSVNVSYDLTIAPGSNGLANLTVSDQGKTMGAVTVQLGSGPFYLLLGQDEGLPSTVGANRAVWVSVSLVGGTLPPDTVANPHSSPATAPVSFTGGPGGTVTTAPALDTRDHRRNWMRTETLQFLSN